MGKSIKELADELGYTKTTIRKYLTPEIREKHTTVCPGNRIEIDEEGCALIAETMQKVHEQFPPVPQQTPEPLEAESPENPQMQYLQEEIAFLRSQIEAKDRQLDAQNRHMEEKDRQILKLQDTLNRTLEGLTAAQEQLSIAQRLHAGTIQSQLQPGPQTAPAASEEQPEAAPTGEPEQPARKSLWQRIFGL